MKTKNTISYEYIVDYDAMINQIENPTERK